MKTKQATTKRQSAPKPLRVVEINPGLGGFRKALDKVCNEKGKPYKTLFISESNPIAETAYKRLFGDIENYPSTEYMGRLEDGIDIVFYSFPLDQLGVYPDDCGAYFMFEHALKSLAWTPLVLIAELPKNLLSKNYLNYYYEWENALAKMGYETFAKILNAAEFGLPQRRERAYLVSVLQDENEMYRARKKFEFPDPYPLTKTLNDILETEVDPKFFLTNEQIRRRSLSGYSMNMIGEGSVGSGIADTLFARDYKDPQCVYLGKRKGTPVYRKLTPKEYMRLMGFEDADFDKLKEKEGLSNSKIYQLVGGGNATTVLAEILRKVI